MLQATEDVHKYTEDFPEQLLWDKPAGKTSVGFHLQHLIAVLDRMLTYAAGKPLSEVQFEYFKNEGNPESNSGVDALTAAFEAKVEKALQIFKNTAETILTEKKP